MFYDGNNIFGSSVTCIMTQNPSEFQLNAFFGSSGILSLYGGGRGRVFLITGLLTGADEFALADARALMLSYDDGIGRVLTDNLGVDWPFVVFLQMQQTDRVMWLAGNAGLCFPYRAVFEGRL